LKSPVIRNSCGVVAAEERKELNSSRKTEEGLEYVDVHTVLISQVVPQLGGVKQR